MIHAALVPWCHGDGMVGWWLSGQAIDFAQAVGIDENIISKAEAKLQEHKVWLHFSHGAGNNKTGLLSHAHHAHQRGKKIESESFIGFKEGLQESFSKSLALAIRLCESEKQ